MTTSYLNPKMNTNRHNKISAEQQSTNNNNSSTAKTKVLNEQILSQKFDQLSPFNKNNQTKDKPLSTNMSEPPPTTTTCLIGTTLLNINGMDFQTNPNYLSCQNQAFEKKMQSIRPLTIQLEELRGIAILIYKIMFVERVKSLWIVYRKSGMGDLPSMIILPINHLNIKIWPPEIQSYMKLFKFNRNTNDDNSSLTFVNHCLCQLDDQSKEYRQQLNVKTSRLVGYTRSLEYTIEKFVEQGLQSLRMEIDQQIALVQYHYTDSLLKRAYLAQNPNERQIQLVKRVCKLKYDQEMTKHEVNFLKQKIPMHMTSHPFEQQSIGYLSIIDDICDPIIRQQLYRQYKDTAEQARIKMMNISLECAEEQRNRCQQQFNVEVKQMWDTEKTLSSEQQLTPMMQNLINQRLTNITARIECLYKCKIQLYQTKSNIH